MEIVWFIASNERLQAWRDWRLVTGAVALFLLLLFSLSTGFAHYIRLRQEHAQAQRDERERWLNQGLKNPHLAAHQGLVVFKPAGPLSIIDDGIAPYAGQATHLEAENRKVFSFKPVADGPLLERLGRVSCSFLLQSLVPLFLFLLCYPAIAAERERGTLRLALGMGVQGSELVLGKVLGWLPLLAVIFGGVASVGALALILHGDGGQTLAHWLLLSTSYGIYWLTIAAFGVVVSASAASSRQALLVLTGLWFWICLLAPQVVSTAIQFLEPVPSGPEFAAAIQADKLNALMRLKNALPATERVYAAEVAASAPGQRPAGLALQDSEDARTHVFTLHFDRLYGIYKRQERLYEWASAASPMIGLSSLSMAITGSDIGGQRSFEEAAEQYRQGMVRTLNMDIALHRDPNLPGHRMEADYLRGRDLWETIPAFSYRSPGLSVALTDHWRGIVMLCAWSGFSMSALLLTGRRLALA